MIGLRAIKRVRLQRRPPFVVRRRVVPFGLQFLDGRDFVQVNGPEYRAVVDQALAEHRRQLDAVRENGA